MKELTKKGQATRDRIVTAAAGLMYAEGVAGTSTDDVKTAAGVSMSQIYHYFRDKQELVHAVVAYWTADVLRHQEAMLADLDSMAALRAWGAAIVALQRERGCAGGCPIGSLGSELADSDETARAALADGFERWEIAIRQGLHAMRDRGELRADADPDELALATLTALQGGLLLTQVRRDTTALEAGLAAVFAHVETFRA